MVDKRVEYNWNLWYNKETAIVYEVKANERGIQMQKDLTRHEWRYINTFPNVSNIKDRDIFISMQL